MPIVICATSISYRCDLHLINDKLEEAGIRLTAYLRTPAAYLRTFENESAAEKQIRERQRIMHALEELSKAVHEAVDKGRVHLMSTPEEQQKLLYPSKRKRSQESGLRIVGNDQEQGHE